MKQTDLETRFVVCVKNEGYPASLELRTVYQVIADTRAAEHQLTRVVDESGEDYLYPADYFVSIELPQAVEKVFSLSAEHSLQRAPFVRQRAHARGLLTEAK